VDFLGYDDQVIQDMQGRLKQNDLKLVSIKSYLKAPVAASGSFYTYSGRTPLAQVPPTLAEVQ